MGNDFIQPPPRRLAAGTLGFQAADDSSGAPHHAGVAHLNKINQKTCSLLFTISLTMRIELTYA